jgi:O-antigen/teichoic acid export membrane protein
MTRIHRNLAANLAGRAAIAVIGIVSVPFYVHFLGIEAYGLLGVFAALQTAFAILGNGLTSTMIREIARLSESPDDAQNARNFARSLEIVHWALGLLIGVPIVALSPILAHWVNARTLGYGTIAYGMMVVGAVIALQSPQSLYDGGLVGLQRQVVSNAISVGAALFRSLGALLLLRFVAPTLGVFLAWQLISTSVQLAVTGFAMWHYLPKTASSPKFSLASLQQVSRFAAGVSATTALTLGLTQGDKIILSRLLPLDVFGLYMIATTAAGGLQYLISPIVLVFFPRFSQLTRPEQESELRLLYHRAAQTASVIILPATVVFALFSREVLLLWTRNPTIAANAHLTASLLAIAIALNGLYHVPYALQLAFGWTRIGFYWNLVALAFMVPLLFVATGRWGQTGAAALLVALNAACLLIIVPLTHRRLLSGELGRWFAIDTGVPLTSSLLIAGVSRAVTRTGLSSLQMLAVVVGVSFATLLAASFSTPTIRAWITNAWRGRAASEAMPASLRR